MLSIFSSVCWPADVFFREMCVCDFCPFLIGLCVGFFFLLSLFFFWGGFWSWVIGVLYTFWILAPYQIYHLQISTLSVGSLFVLLMVSFAVQKPFILMWSQKLMFAFVFLALGDMSKKMLLESIWCHRNYYRCFLLGVLWF